VDALGLIDTSATGLELRIALSVIVLSLVGIVFTLSVYYRQTVLKMFDSRVKRVALFLGSVMGIGFTAALLVLVWDVSEPVIHMYAQEIQTSVIVRLFVTVFVLITTYLCTGVLDSLTQRIVQEDGRQVVDEHRREVIFRVSQLVLYILVLIALLNYWNINIGSILIGAGALAALVGFSARQTMSAALAGVVLLFSRPFKVGDWIEVNGTEGTVRRITIVNTILHTPNDEEVVIPNDVISEETIYNKNKSGKLRLAFDVGVAYGTDLDRAIQIAEESVEDCTIVADVPGTQAHVETFGDSSVVIRIYFWIRRPTPRRRTAARSNTQKAIKEAFDEHEIEIPFPQRDVTYSKPQPVESRPSESTQLSDELPTEQPPTPEESAPQQ